MAPSIAAELPPGGPWHDRSADRWRGRPGSALLDRGKICGAGENSLCINPYGQVYAGNTLPLVLGDLKTQTVREIWEESPELKWWRANNERANLTACGDCRLAQECVFCPGEAVMRTGNPLHMYRDACAATHFATARAAERR